MAASSPARSARSAGAMPWDLKALSRVPKTHAAEGLSRSSSGSVRPLCYEAEPYRGGWHRQV